MPAPRAVDDHRRHGAAARSALTAATAAATATATAARIEQDVVAAAAAGTAAGEVRRVAALLGGAVLDVVLAGVGLGADFEAGRVAVGDRVVRGVGVTAQLLGAVDNSGPVGTWTHLVATFRAPVPGESTTGNMALYQNGSLVGTATNLSPPYDSSLPLTVGGCVNSASATTPYLAFPGSVADVHVYPRTLSATEVSNLH
ncbi:LamG-like jellyroll fold domain-containing protein [Streptomyces sp. NPDC007157]|uniref:LamG-like jellyroll fold domain-containing protein n=1 Tax=Streptomyces sp. NPDC007157 TaxID=3154681 RepID=UPI0033F619E4